MATARHAHWHRGFLAIALVLWPASARDRLLAGIDETLEAIARSLEADGARLRGEDVAPPPLPPSPAALRPLVSERRFEPPGRGPDAITLSGVLDGLVAACVTLRARLAGESGRLLLLAEVDPDLSSALENLRSTHLTLAADAAELRALFAAVEALSLIGSGLARADTALGAGARH